MSSLRHRFRRPDRPLDCRAVGKLLHRYLDGEIDDLTARRIAAHLEDCRRCGLEATTYREIKAALARHRAGLPDDALRRLHEFSEQLVREGPPDGGADDEVGRDEAGA